MNAGEILLRLGVDASKVMTGLQRVGAGVRAWGTHLVEDLKGHFGRMIAAGFVIAKTEQGLEAIEERILAIKHAQELLGASSNLVQGIFLEAEKRGLNYEQAIRPLMKFSALIGEAKNGSIQAREALISLGVATKDTNWQTLTFADALAKLAERYKHLDAERRNALLKDAGMLKGGPVIASLLEGGAHGIEELGKNSIFKISNDALENIATLKRLVTSSKGGLLGLAVNVWNRIAPLAMALKLWRAAFGESEETKTAKEAEALEIKQDVVKAQQQLNKLLREQRDLQDAMNDRGKLSVSQLAAQARKLTGAPEPQLFGVSARMRDALRIETLEKRAQIEWMQGKVNDPSQSRFWSEAQQIRAASGWARAEDQFPTRKAEEALDVIIANLPLAGKAADLINKTHDAQGDH